MKVIQFAKTANDEHFQLSGVLWPVSHNPKSILHVFAPLVK